MLTSKCHSDGPYAGHAETSGLFEAHGPPKVHYPGVIVPPAPLSVALATNCLVSKIFEEYRKILL